MILNVLLILLRRILFDIEMEELMMMIQKDPELWDLIEKIKDQDATLEFFLDDVAEMFCH